MKPQKICRQRLSYERQKALVGFLLILPWFIGCIWFFIIPFFKSFFYSFQNLTLDPGQMTATFAGLTHYKKLFTGDPRFLEVLQLTLYNIWYEILIVIVLSCFLAVLMNGKYKGRMLVRGIFFLPVIIASGVVIQVFAQTSMTNGMISGAPSTTMFQGVAFTEILSSIGLPAEIVDLISNIITRLFTLVWKSGVQTILLLAGLQSVPKTAYEAATVEGATKWEIFWKVTFPILSPILVLCSFYTVIDLANDSGHVIVQYIYEYSSKLNFSYASAISNIWFLIILVCVAVVFLVSRKHVFYMEDMG